MFGLRGVLADLISSSEERVGFWWVRSVHNVTDLKVISLANFS